MCNENSHFDTLNSYKNYMYNKKIHALIVSNTIAFSTKTNIIPNQSPIININTVRPGLPNYILIHHRWEKPETRMMMAMHWQTAVHAITIITRRFPKNPTFLISYEY